MVSEEATNCSIDATSLRDGSVEMGSGSSLNTRDLRLIVICANCVSKSDGFGTGSGSGSGSITISGTVSTNKSSLESLRGLAKTFSRLDVREAAGELSFELPENSALLEPALLN